MIRQRIAETDFIAGHICFDEANELRGTVDFRLAITLREPLSRTLSNLRYYLRLPRESLNSEFTDVRDRLEREPFEEYLPALRTQLEIHNFATFRRGSYWTSAIPAGLSDDVTWRSPKIGSSKLITFFWRTGFPIAREFFVWKPTSRYASDCRRSIQ